MKYFIPSILQKRKKNKKARYLSNNKLDECAQEFGSWANSFAFAEVLSGGPYVLKPMAGSYLLLSPLRIDLFLWALVLLRSVWLPLNCPFAF